MTNPPDMPMSFHGDERGAAPEGPAIPVAFPGGAAPTPVAPPHAPQMPQMPHAPHAPQVPQMPRAPMVPQAPIAAPVPPHPAPRPAPHHLDTYTMVGALTADQLLYGNGTEFDHLQDKIVGIREWLQDHLTSQGRDDEIVAARRDPEARVVMTHELDRILIQYMSKESVAVGADRATIMASVINEVLGLGPIEPLWTDSRITEVMVNGPDNVYVEIEGRIVRAAGAKFRDRDHLLEVCQQILIPLNRRVDQKAPLADGRLADGSRVNIAHFSVCPGGPLLTIRRFPDYVWTLKDLYENGSVSEEMACELARLVYHKISMVVVGGTGSGKALDVETPIPTPTGFRRMGDLAVGDTVFDEHGNETTVTGAFDTQHDRPCYKVVFSDGSSIVADAEHLWSTETRTARAQHRLRNLSRNRRTHLSATDTQTLTTWAQTRAAGETVTVARLVTLMGWPTSRRHEVQHIARTLNPATAAGGVITLPDTTGYDARELAAALLDRWAQTPTTHTTASVSSVVNTEEIRATLHTSSGQPNHSVARLTAPVHYAPKDLPVDPYLFGLWLAAGEHNSASLTAPTPAQAVVHAAAFAAANYTTRNDATNPNGFIVTDGFEASLRRTGALGNKHVPVNYLTSSIEQRHSLLAGFIAGAGATDASHDQNQVTHPNLALLTQFRSLVASLGHIATLDTQAVPGQQCTATLTYTNASDSRKIVDVRPIASRPVRCIRVSSDSHLFLAGEQYVPTHNTSLLNALSSCIPRTDRIITVEDSLELRFHPDAHVASMEARPAAASGEGEVRIRDLVKNSLRMRPDRVVVGEVRDSAALDMLQAMNTGHEGSMTTVHANGPDEAVGRLEVLVAMGGDIPESKVRWLIGDAVDCFVQQRRYEDGSRRVSGIYEVPSMKTSINGELTPIPLWEWEQTGIDEDGKFIGSYVKRNEISERLATRPSMVNARQFTIEDVYRMSELPEDLRKKSE